MSKTFGFGDVEDIKGRIEPGIEEVEFTGVIDGKNDNDKDFLSFGTISLDGNREHTERFYFTTEKGEKISLQRIRSIIKELLGEEKAKGNYTVAELNAMLTGKKARIKFVGDEYEYNNELRVKTQFGFSGFIEKLETNPSKLTFNPQKDIKRLSIAPSNRAQPSSANNVTDELF